MSLIQSELDDPATLRAEDEAIAAAENPQEPKVTALDALAEILNDDTPPVHESSEG